MQINKSKVVHVIITDNSQKTEINHHCSDDITDFLEYSNILSYKIYIKNHKLGIFFVFYHAFIYLKPIFCINVIVFF